MTHDLTSGARPGGGMRIAPRSSIARPRARTVDHPVSPDPSPPTRAASELARTADEVAPGLWLGGHLATPPDQVGRVVALVAGATPTPVGVPTHLVTLRRGDARCVQLDALDAAATRIEWRGHPTLVRCRYGVGDGALLVAVVLRRRGWDSSEVLAAVRTARPGALLDPDHVDLIRRLPEVGHAVGGR